MTHGSQSRNKHEKCYAVEEMSKLAEKKENKQNIFIFG